MLTLPPSEINAINQIERGNQQSYDDTWEQIGQRIAKELPSTGMEKFDAWRRISMLLNPKTHIRNVGGQRPYDGHEKNSRYHRGGTPKSIRAQGTEDTIIWLELKQKSIFNG